MEGIYQHIQYKNILLNWIKRNKLVIQCNAMHEQILRHSLLELWMLKPDHWRGCLRDLFRFFFFFCRVPVRCHFPCSYFFFEVSTLVEFFSGRWSIDCVVALSSLLWVRILFRSQLLFSCCLECCVIVVLNRIATFLVKKWAQRLMKSLCLVNLSSKRFLLMWINFLLIFVGNLYMYEFFFLVLYWSVFVMCYISDGKLEAEFLVFPVCFPLKEIVICFILVFWIHLVYWKLRHFMKMLRSIMGLLKKGKFFLLSMLVFLLPRIQIIFFL